jgi:hypothetical protein
MKWTFASLALAAVAAMSSLLARHSHELLASQPHANKDSREHQWQGAASCSAAACHGANGRPGSKSSEYSTWADHDAHNRAYRVLFDECSRRIARNLGLDRPAHESALCLNCHGTLPPDHLRGDRFQASDGVSCEGCHGPAQHWLAEHYLPAWKTLTSAQKESRGFQNTTDLLIRARQCVDCHVGKGDADVNHDLLAAGHPRLQFEFNLFLASVPKHWSEQDEKARYPDFEARAWLIGQAVTAKASLDLLAERAAKKTDRIWPEFAEYECAACHHNVGGRPVRAASPGEGLLPWADWTTSLLSKVLEVESGTADPVLQSGLMNLRKEMGRALPETALITRETRRTTERLDRWAERLNQARSEDAGTLRNLFMALSTEEPGARTSADRDVLRYLGMRATRSTLLETAPERVDEAWKPLLEKISRSVRLPPNKCMP